jgi:hypothetical protein
MNASDSFNEPQPWIEVIETGPPLRPASGELAELETVYIRQRNRNDEICRELDRLKRTPGDLTKLREMINGQATNNTKKKRL